MTDLHAAINEADEREAFEAWLLKRYPDREDRQAEFRMTSVRDLMFQAWCAAVSAPPVPEGYKPVPIEPTPEMKAAAVRFANGDAVYKNVKAEALKIEEDIYGEVYEAMLAAAPSPQEKT